MLSSRFTVVIGIPGSNLFGKENAVPSTSNTDFDSVTS
jgi:hypothetical protein